MTNKFNSDSQAALTSEDIVKTYNDLDITQKSDYLFMTLLLAWQKLDNVGKADLEAAMKDMLNNLK